MRSLPRVAVWFAVVALSWTASGGPDYPPRVVPEWAKPGPVSARMVGKGVGGAMFGLAIDIKDANIAYVGGDMGTTLARTTDGGRSWKPVGVGPDGNPMVVGNVGFGGVKPDPKDPNVVWCGTSNGLYKSLDRGLTWKEVGEGTKAGDAHALIPVRLGIDPSDTDIVYMPRINTRGNGPGPNVECLKTTDGGKSWQLIAKPRARVTYRQGCSEVAVDPTSPFVPGQGHQRVFAFCSYGVAVSNDAGRTWVWANGDLPIHRCASRGQLVVRDGKPVLFALVGGGKGAKVKRAGAGGLYRSDDLGKTWVDAAPAMRSKLLYAGGRVLGGFRFAPSNPDVGYIAAYVRGVYKTIDGGKTWRQTFLNAARYIKFRDATGLEQFYNIALKVPPNEVNVETASRPFVSALREFAVVDVAPSDPNVCMLTEGKTTWRTSDGGATWFDTGAESGERFAPPGRFEAARQSRYLHKLRCRGFHNIVADDIAADHFDPRTFAIAYTDEGLRITRDGGEWWEWSYWGILGHLQSECGMVTYDPQVKGRMYCSGTVYAGLVKRHKLYHEWILYRSDDGGRLWKPIPIPPLTAVLNAVPSSRTEWSGRRAPRCDAAVRDLVIDTTTPPERRRLLAGSTFGLFISDDGGKTWRLAPVGPDPHMPVARIVPDPRDPKRVFVGLRYADRGPRFRKKFPLPKGVKSDRLEGLFVSKSGGPEAGFARLAPGRIGHVQEIALCRDKPDTLYVTAADPNGHVRSAWYRYDLWKTTDGGRAWRKLDYGAKRYVCGLAVNARDPNRVYMCTRRQVGEKPEIGLFRSTDGGVNWRRLHCGIISEKTSLGRALRIDPVDARRLFCITSANSWIIWDLEAPK